MRSFISVQLLLVVSFVLLLNIDESVAPVGDNDSRDGGFNADVEGDLGGRVSVDHENGRINIVDPVGGRVHEGKHEGGLKDVVESEYSGINVRKVTKHNGSANQEAPNHAKATVTSKHEGGLKDVVESEYSGINVRKAAGRKGPKESEKA